MSAAAIFDLDRTLLNGGSGPTISRVLRDHGVTDRSIPAEGALYWLYRTFGENRASMVLAREGVRFTRGWQREAVVNAGIDVAAALVDVVQPYAAAEMAAHRRAGRRLVLATTTPHDLVGPFATAMGFDHVIATRYGVVDGAYDGTIDGRFVWHRDKRAAVEEWAAAEGVDLATSYAYSDSRYDIPLLEAVGAPVAVNPDARLRLYAELRGWPVRHLDAPEGVLRVAGLELQRWAMPFFRPELLLFADVRVEGHEHLPTTGPAIVAANHRSYFDPIALGYVLARQGRPGRFLAKRELFDSAPSRRLMEAVGAIPVDRGSGSDEPLAAAADVLAAGEVVVVLPEGTIPRGDALDDGELRGRPGVARLAAMTGAPVIPAGLWGTERVWPRESRFPRVFDVVDPPTVAVTVGEPVTLHGTDVHADTRQIMSAIRHLLPG